MHNKLVLGLSATLLILNIFSIASADTVMYLGLPAFGARASAIGGLTAGGGDISSVYWNPADMVNNQKAGFILGRDNKFNLGDWYEDQIGFALPLGGKFGIGGFYINDSVSLISERGNHLITSPWSTRFLGISFGMRLTSGLSIGTTMMQLNFKGTLEGVEEESGALLNNVGLNLKRGPWSLGFVRHNYRLSGDLKVEHDYRVGIAWQKPELRFQLEFISYVPPEKDNREWSLGGGVEFEFRPGLSFRVGRSQMRTNEPGYLTVGLGANIRHWGIDYSYAPHNVGATHYISTSFQY